ncbi:MAG TPA: YggS family pyridoxal phosphate-dependent enzyme [Chitinophagaceae bacterium]|nr:YggS family pyridoxal phosphate-dependent enzyme [Chitinophagaceae bacterium]
MAINTEVYKKIREELRVNNGTLVAVSKIQPISKIKELYDLGQRDFGENYVQELAEKYESLPKDILWHFIGHLQTNKVKYIAPFVSLIHGVDTFKLLKEINKQGEKNNRVMNCLLQIHIAQEETKFGLSENELDEIFNSAQLKDLNNIMISGMMGMASFTENEEKIRNEFRYLKNLFLSYSQLSIINCQLSILSMGMSDDYKIAIEEGSNMVRIGSLIFGNRNNANV